MSELDTVLDTMVDGVIMIDDAGIIRRYNPACERIFGYHKNEAIGQDVSLLMPEPDKSNHHTYISNYKKSGEAKIIGSGRKVRGRGKDGQIFPMYLSVGQMPDNDKNAFVAIIRDLSAETERQNRFDILQQEHFHLSRLAAMDQLGTSIAHELNQPLTAVMNYLEAGAILIAQTDKFESEKLERIFKDSKLQTDRAAKILSRLRAFIETGNMETTSEDITGLLDTSLSLVMPSYRNLNISVKFDLPESPPQVQVNDIQIQQVFVNLIRNACEAMHSAKVKTLTLSVEKISEAFIKIGVCDTGIGVDSDKFKQLFEPFSSTKKNGLGVGLSICKTIIIAHDGEIWAEQNPSTGSAFYFTLPLAKGAIEA